MATNLAIDTDLLDQALQIGRFDTKKDAEKIVLKLTLEILEWGMQGIACLYIPVPDIKNAPVALHLYYYY